MEELLNKLLEADVLSEDTKKELEETIKTRLEEAEKAAREEAEKSVRAELTEQWVKERDALIDAVDAKVTEYLENETSELREDIERFRDLEAEQAEKLVEAKGEMAGELKKDLQELVERLDAFLEIRLAAEFDELREDLDEQKKKDFGRRIFEAVAEEYRDSYVDEESTEAELVETRERLDDTEKALEESERKRETLERVRKLEEILEPLEGRTRDVMEAILKNVATSQLQEGYKTFIGRVIKETEKDSETTSEKEEKVLAEGKKETSKKKLKKDEAVKKTGNVDDDSKDEDEENEEGKNKLSEAARVRLQKLAGVKRK